MKPPLNDHLTPHRRSVRVAEVIVLCQGHTVATLGHADVAIRPRAHEVRREVVRPSPSSRPAAHSKTKVGEEPTPHTDDLRGGRDVTSREKCASCVRVLGCVRSCALVAVLTRAWGADKRARAHVAHVPRMHATRRCAVLCVWRYVFIHPVIHMPPWVMSQGCFWRGCVLPVGAGSAS